MNGKVVVKHTMNRYNFAAYNLAGVGPEPYRFKSHYRTLVRDNGMWDAQVQTMEVIVADFAPEAVQGAVAVVHPDALEGFEDAVPASESHQLVEVVHEVFGPVLSYMGIVKACSAGDIISANGVMHNSPLNFVGCVFPYARQQVLMANKLGQPLNHPKCWFNHMEWRHQTNWLEFGVKVPMDFVAGNEHAGHARGMNSLRDRGKMVVGETFLAACVYKKTAVAMAILLDSPIVKRAYKDGWTPVMAFKNMLPQTYHLSSAPGQTRLSSCDLHQHTYVSLIGFYKKRGDNCGLIGFNKDGKPFTTSDTATLTEHGG